MNNNKSVRAIVSDFDGVFLRYDFLGNKVFYHLTMEMASKAIEELSLIALSEKARRAITIVSYQEFNNQTEYAHLALNISRDEMHKRYHRYLFEALERRHPAFFEQSKALTPHFNALSNAVEMVAILSHASSHEFIAPSLEKMALASCFNGRNKIFAPEEFGVQYMKRHHDEPFIHVEQQLGLKGGEIVFIEDSPENLVIPKGRGWRTVWLTQSEHNKHHVGKIDYSAVDASFSCLSTFCQAYLREKEAVFNGQYKPQI